LNWSAIRLGRRSNLNENAILNFEEGRRILSANDLTAIRAALEAELAVSALVAFR
jgi:hypothetical protein